MRVGEVFLDLDRKRIKVEVFQHLADRLTAHHGFETMRKFNFRFSLLGLGQKLTVFKIRFPWIGHHKVFKVNNAFELFQREVEHMPDATGQTLEKPDMGDGACKLDMTEPLTAHL